MQNSKITKLKLKKFTAFEDIEMDFSPGINIFIGANATGKTHILKVLYSACDITKDKKSFPIFAEKLNNVFLPSQRFIGRLVNRKVGRGRALVEVFRGENLKIGCTFSNLKKIPSREMDKGTDKWCSLGIESAYIPVKEMLANSPEFISLYAKKEIHFEEVYNDILLQAYSPIHRGPFGKKRTRYIRVLEKVLDGRVIQKNFEFFLKRREGELEFTLVAEGMRKLALLLLLILNDTLIDGSVLFWDGPETNLNPNMEKIIVELLLKLQRDGVQIFIATHDNVLLKEFDLQKTTKDQIKFFSLYRDKENKIVFNTADNYIMLEPNLIQDTSLDQFDRDIARALGRKK
jgi:energy-coupling factor transporter ATP-binding protein EcfA2